MHVLIEDKGISCHLQCVKNVDSVVTKISYNFFNFFIVVYNIYVCVCVLGTQTFSHIFLIDEEENGEGMKSIRKQ